MSEFIWQNFAVCWLAFQFRSEVCQFSPLFFATFKLHHQVFLLDHSGIALHAQSWMRLILRVFPVTVLICFIAVWGGGGEQNQKHLNQRFIFEITGNLWVVFT